MEVKRWPLLTAAIVQFTVSMGMVLLLQFRMRELGAGLFLVSLIASIRGGTSTVMSSIWGKISDKRRNRKGILLICVIGGAVFVTLYAFAFKPWQILLITVAVAVFASGFNPVAMALSTEYSRRKSSRARELSFLNSSNSLGMLIGRLTTGFLLMLVSVKVAMFYLSFLAWLEIVPTLMIREKPSEKPERSEPEVRLKASNIVARNGLWALYVAAFLRQFGTSGMMSLAAIYLSEKIGLSKYTVSFITAINPFIQIPSHLFFGKMMDKTSSKLVSVIGLLLSSAVALLFLIGKTPFEISLAYALLGFAFGAFINGMGYFITKSTGRWERAYALGILSSSRQFGATIGPFVGGILAGFSYNALFTTMMISMFTGAVLMWFFAKEPESEEIR